MPWRETNAMEQRKEFIEKLLSRRWTMTELCHRYGVSRVTGHKWWKRFKEHGYTGLAELSRAPKSCPHRTEQEIERYGNGIPVLAHVPVFEPLKVVYGGKTEPPPRVSGYHHRH